MCDWLFSGALERYPSLKIAHSEGNIGWIPYILERADRLWRETKWSYDTNLIKRPPSKYFADHVFGCYVSDSFGLESLQAVGENNVTFETDYPHIDTSFPYTVDLAKREPAHLSDEQALKILRGTLFACCRWTRRSGNDLVCQWRFGRLYDDIDLRTRPSRQRSAPGRSNAGTLADKLISMPSAAERLVGDTSTAMVWA
jgi:hypothetical protein